jgi:hypothetical protein
VVLESLTSQTRAVTVLPVVTIPEDDPVPPLRPPPAHPSVVVYEPVLQAWVQHTREPPQAPELLRVAQYRVLDLAGFARLSADA